MSDWQPIETMLEGIEVLAFWSDAPMPYDVVTKRGRQFFFSDDEYTLKLPTHWMLLEPPK